MNSVLESSDAKNSVQIKSNVIKEISAPDIPNKKVTDDDVLRKRKLRFAGTALPESKVPSSNKETSDILEKRQIRFNKDTPMKSNEDIVGALKRRKERFGKITSTLLKKIEEQETVLKRKAKFAKNVEVVQQIEEQEKVLRRKAKFAENVEVVQQIGKKPKKLKLQEKLCEEGYDISSSKQMAGL